MNLSQQAGSAAFTTISGQFNSGYLHIYSGAMPASPETGLSGNTLLVTFRFSANAFPTTVFDPSGYQKGNAAFSANPVTPVASGTASFARALQSDNATVIADFVLAQGWQTSLSVSLSQYIYANNNLYICTTAGTTSSSAPGPNTTGIHVLDGTAYWMYLRSGAPDVLLSTAALSTSTPLTWPYLWLAMPCV